MPSDAWTQADRSSRFAFLRLAWCRCPTPFAALRYNIKSDPRLFSNLVMFQTCVLDQSDNFALREPMRGITSCRNAKVRRTPINVGLLYRTAQLRIRFIEFVDTASEM